MEVLAAFPAIYMSTGENENRVDLMQWRKMITHLRLHRRTKFLS
jgi:hypothetical protein